MRKKLQKLLKSLGPGVITGASGDDPSGIATYSQTGAQFGFGQLWSALYVLPFLVAVQEACARIGAVTGAGLAHAIGRKYGHRTLYLIIPLLMIAITINIGANIGAMAEAVRLVTPFAFAPLTIVIVATILILEIFVSYRVYARLLKWLALSLFAYPLTLFIIHAPWGTIIPATFVPHFELNFAFFFIATGVLGTTISPYLFFWQASEEVEEERALGLIKRGIARVSGKFMVNLRLDTLVGMIFSQLGTWSIIIVAATVLHNSGITDIKTAADAARALEPLVSTFESAGYLAKLLFATGIVGLGLLSIPVMAGSAAYALAATLNFRDGLGLKFRQAHGFYGAITLATLLGLLINYVGIDPMKALVYAAVLNGFVSVPLLYLIAKISADKAVMGRYRSGLISRSLIYLTFLGMSASVLGTLYMFLRS